LGAKEGFIEGEWGVRNQGVLVSERDRGFEGRSDRCSGVKGFKEGRGFFGKRRGFREGEVDV
jgi:hypothetical protein